MANLLKRRNSNEPQYSVVFYLKPIEVINVLNGINELRLELCNKNIPYQLKDLFTEQFGDGISQITEESINKFIEENS